MKKLITLLAVAVFVIGCASTNATKQNETGELDYGDYASQTLTTRAWDALEAGNYTKAIQYTDKCIELYEEQAIEMQEAMKTGVETRGKKPAYEVHANWALNDVGTSYYIKGEALAKLGKDDKALAAYKAVVNRFYYAQTWDPKGWFWSPSEAATPKVARLSGDF